jgi:hypothetical protein
MSTTLRQKFAQNLAARFKYDTGFNLAFVLAGIASVVHIGWFVVSFFAFRRRIDAVTTVVVDWDPSVFMMHIRIAVALLLSMGAFLSRRALGLFLSALALVWVILEYVVWFLWSVRIKANADIDAFPSSVPHALNLYGATIWNVVVFTMVIAALAWTIWCLTKIARSNPVRVDSREVGA